MNTRTVKLFGQLKLEKMAIDPPPPLNDTPAVLVTVPLCPLYNPGNPGQGAALLVVARRGNGAGQSAALARQHSAAAEVKVTMGLRAGSIALLGPTKQPTSSDTHHILWSLADEASCCPHLRPLDPQHWVGPVLGC